MTKVKALFYSLPAAIVLWVFVSWIDVISHNLTTQTYFAWNAFEVFGRYLVSSGLV